MKVIDKETGLQVCEFSIMINEIVELSRSETRAVMEALHSLGKIFTFTMVPTTKDEK